MRGGSMGQQSELGRPRWGQKLRGASPVAERDELVAGAVSEAQVLEAVHQRRDDPATARRRHHEQVLSAFPHRASPGTAPGFCI
jgi:hypothetical protein